MAHEQSSDGSALHHAIERMPCVWPESVPSGTVTLERRSQSRITGFWSSPIAVIMCSPSVGFHAMSAIEPRCASRSSHHGFFCRRSQTMHVPFAEEVARMCETCEFHATRVTSAECLAVLGGGAGTKTVGASGRSSDVMKTSSITLMMMMMAVTPSPFMSPSEVIRAPKES